MLQDHTSVVHPVFHAADVQTYMCTNIYIYIYMHMFQVHTCMQLYVDVCIYGSISFVQYSRYMRGPPERQPCKLHISDWVKMGVMWLVRRCPQYTYIYIRTYVTCVFSISVPQMLGSAPTQVEFSSMSRTIHLTEKIFHQTRHLLSHDTGEGIRPFPTRP